ncbi:MAG TPA: hypothetical protein VN669_01190 [Candidatus Acidoferrales bacterium]|nr:hypothetical protein [Candidatus Acidoferrales bacterium]
MSARLLLALPFLLSVCYPQLQPEQARPVQAQPAQSPHRAPSSAQIYGFQGPVHTSKFLVRQLGKDPRSAPKLPVRLLQKGWMVFDESGQLTEEGDLDPAGKIEHVVRRYFDGDGQQNTTELVDGQKITRYALKTATATDGAVERSHSLNGTLQFKEVSRINEPRSAGETTVTDANGKTVSRTRWEQEGSTHTMESWGQDGKFIFHSQRTTDDEGRITNSSRFDETGRLVSSMSFYQGELTSFWQDPDCKCTNTAAFLGKDGSTVFYTTNTDGKLYKEVQRHPGRLTNQEMEVDELYDQNGELLEKIVYAYVRDEHGNWTKRTVSVLDPSTNEMVAVQEDTRELSYY